MGLLQEIGSMVGGPALDNMAAGQGNFGEPTSDDSQHFQRMASAAPQGVLQGIFSNVAQKMNPQQYSDHVTPGVGGTNPLGSLGSGGLATIASALLGKLTGGGSSSNAAPPQIPGVPSNVDPRNMTADQVAALSRYVQQNHPDQFGQAAAQVAQQQPDLLHGFLGKAGLALGAAALASHFIKLDR